MALNRRSFIQNTSLAAGALLAGKSLTAFSKVMMPPGSKIRQLSILHTNDLHGQLAFLDNEKSFIHGLGGLNQVRQVLAGKNGLILDAGNFLHDGRATGHAANPAAGQPASDYPDAAHRRTITALNAAGYHAAAIGNHELSLGQQRLAALCGTMNFPLLNANYDFGNGPLSQYVLPYFIMHYGNCKIGITAVGPEPDTFLASAEGIGYKEPYKAAQESARYLRDRGCQLVICLSHLGLSQSADLATCTSGIDLVLSGDGDVFQQSPYILRNAKDEEVILSQSARHGLMMREITFHLTEDGSKTHFDTCSYLPGQPEGESFHKRYRQILRERA